MNVTRLRQQCEARLQALGLPTPCDLPGLCRMIEQRRRRRILLHPLPMRAIGLAASGVCVGTTTADYIFFERDTTPLHQLHIQLHELAHLVCGHQTGNAADADLVQLLLPSFVQARVQRLLRRTVYTAVEEQEAEVLASLLLARITPPPPAADPGGDVAAIDLLHRLGRSLEDAASGDP
jgi:hypothetical protein